MALPFFVHPRPIAVQLYFPPSCRCPCLNLLAVNYRQTVGKSYMTHDLANKAVLRVKRTASGSHWPQSGPSGEKRSFLAE